MSIDLLERAGSTLRPVLGEVVFLGGATVTLWITDPGAPPVRATKDVDVVVEVTTRSAFYAFEQRLRSLGFAEDQEDGVICRWRHDETGLIPRRHAGRPQHPGVRQPLAGRRGPARYRAPAAFRRKDPCRPTGLPPRHQD